MRLGYLGLGSNVGDRRANLQAAVEELWTHGVTVLASSSVYETEPVGEVLDQREFLNACVRIETELEPEPLLDACKAVERALGREPAGVRHGPRPIDVDVLLLEGVEHESERLRLPHREVHDAALRARAAARARSRTRGAGRRPAADALAALGGPGGPARRAAARRARLAFDNGETCLRCWWPWRSCPRRRGAGGDVLRRHHGSPAASTSRRWPPRCRRRPTRPGSTRSGSAAGPRTPTSRTRPGEPVRVVGAGRRATELAGRVDLGEDRSSVAALTVREPPGRARRARRGERPARRGPGPAARRIGAALLVDRGRAWSTAGRGAHAQRAAVGSGPRRRVGHADRRPPDRVRDRCGGPAGRLRRAGEHRQLARLGVPEPASPAPRRPRTRTCPRAASTPGSSPARRPAAAGRLAARRRRRPAAARRRRAGVRRARRRPGDRRRRRRHRAARHRRRSSAARRRRRRPPATCSPTPAPSRARPPRTTRRRRRRRAGGAPAASRASATAPSSAWWRSRRSTPPRCSAPATRSSPAARRARRPPPRWSTSRAGRPRSTPARASPMRLSALLGGYPPERRPRGRLGALPRPVGRAARRLLARRGDGGRARQRDDADGAAGERAGPAAHALDRGHRAVRDARRQLQRRLRRRHRARAARPAAAGRAAAARPRAAAVRRRRGDLTARARRARARARADRVPDGVRPAAAPASSRSRAAAS